MNLFTTLVQKRHQVALNAGFENYRDYRFKELGRFDYTKEDCFQFHEAVKQHVLPLVNKIYENKKKKLGLDTLTALGYEAEPEGYNHLVLLKQEKNYWKKQLPVFSKLRPFFGDCLRKMKEMEHLDLESRKGKARADIIAPC